VLHVHKVGSNHIGIKECAVGGVVCMARVDGVLALRAPQPDLECAFVSSVQPSCFTSHAAVHRKNGVGAAENHTTASFTSLLWSGQGAEAATHKRPTVT